MTYEATTHQLTDSPAVQANSQSEPQIEVARPVIADGPEIHGLIAACPPLDGNSVYANLIQCAHFANSCATARIDGQMRGWISGHRPPERENTYFLWQVAVHPNARGTGLAQKMLAHILARPEHADVQKIETSITESNEPSWAFFHRIAAELGAPMNVEPWFEQDRHFAGNHDTEHLVGIGPFAGRKLRR